MAFLHGVNTTNQLAQGQPGELVKSSIIALVGIAPIGDAQKLVRSVNPTDDAQFGKPVPGFNIPKTLQIIRQIAGSTPVLVVNVFDVNTHTTDVVDEVVTVANGKFSLAFAPIGAITVKNNDNSPATIVAGTDYSIDEYGKGVVLSGTIANGTSYKFTYKKLNAGAVTSSHIIGTTNGSGVRTGLQLFDEAYNQFGYNPKVLLSPGYIAVAAVAAEMRAKALKYRAIYLQDAPYGTTVSGALNGRGVGGTINFNTNSSRAFLLYPFIKSFDEATGTDLDYSFSAYMAGVIALTDRTKGFWKSPSNEPIPNATGVEKLVTFNPNDENSEANQLNAAGITTVVTRFGTGFVTWGNRSAAFPTSTNPLSFITLQRIDDVIAETMEQSVVEDLDKPITRAFIDYLVDKGQALMNDLIQKGAILPGSKIVYNPEDNTAENLAAGKVVLERVYMGVTPAETITFKNVIDISLYNQLNA